MRSKEKLSFELSLQKRVRALEQRMVILLSCNLVQGIAWIKLHYRTEHLSRAMTDTIDWISRVINVQTDTIEGILQDIAIQTNSIDKVLTIITLLLKHLNLM